MRFEWDPRKAEANLRKHGVSFEEAVSAFKDPFAHIFSDPDHSAVEEREVLVGHSATGRLLVVCFTERGGSLRLFSVRQATRHERRGYEERS